jgi:DNA end-binding protein Ku
MPRGIASGTISFGLVTVPVKLYTATQSKSLSFRLLHAKDSARLRQQYICTACEEVVERADMTRGYEHAKGQYVVLSEDELKALEQSSDQSIEIEEFVPLSAVDPIYFESTNYLGPDKGAARAYRLLCEAMAAHRSSRRGRGTPRAAASSSCWCARRARRSSCTGSTTPTRCATPPRSTTAIRRRPSRRSSSSPSS